MKVQVYNISETYIGVKIISSDSSENIINTDEEVLIKNEKDNKIGKLAIPGLEVGDILDYYIRVNKRLR
jgi:hypothetical protein